MSNKKEDFDKSKVYFVPIDSYKKTKEINEACVLLLQKLGFEPKGKIPIKVHFGEKGNETFIEPKNFEGIIKQLKKKGAEPYYTETNALYKGERTFSESHIKLAKEHGFTQLPIVIADGDHGENFVEVEINGKHFKECKVGKEIVDSKQLLVVAHFKGHMLAGFGGAIKQLGMGCAARGGKLGMHANSKPLIIPIKCKKCGICLQNCPANAIELGLISAKIDKNKCIGCATCIAVCPYGAAQINWISTMPKQFVEKLAEYALAAQKEKRVAYINFVLNITSGCDCMGKKMEPIITDIGVLASFDPVALDKACFDLVTEKAGKKVFGGEHVFEHAENIGLGKQKYNIIECTK